MTESSHRSAVATGKQAIFAVTALALAGSLAAGAYQFQGIDYLGYALRVTARISLLAFLLAYAARPLVQLLDRGRWLLRNRRYLGLAAAASHTVHFGYVLAHDRLAEQPADPATWILGGAAFGLFWIMALTSNDASVRRLGRRWKHLHRFGMHYIWLVFFYTYLGAALGAGGWYWVFPVALAAALGLRVAAFLRRRAPRVARA